MFCSDVIKSNIDCSKQGHSVKTLRSMIVGFPIFTPFSTLLTLLYLLYSHHYCTHCYIAPAVALYIYFGSVDYDISSTYASFGQIEASLIHEHKSVRDFTYKNYITKIPYQWYLKNTVCLTDFDNWMECCECDDLHNEIIHIYFGE